MQRFSPRKPKRLTEAEHICDTYLQKEGVMKSDDLCDDIGNTRSLHYKIDAALTAVHHMRSELNNVTKMDLEINSQINKVSKECNQLLNECQTYWHETELDRYLDKTINCLDEYGRSIKLVTYPYQHGPSRITELRRRFAQLLQLPKSTESDTVVGVRKPDS